MAARSMRPRRSAQWPLPDGTSLASTPIRISALYRDQHFTKQVLYVRTADHRHFRRSVHSSEDGILGHARKPMSKSYVGISFFPPINCAEHPDQIGLSEVLSIGVLHPAFTGHAINDRAINGCEFSPSVAILRRSHLGYQGWLIECLENRSHSSSARLNSRGRRDLTQKPTTRENFPPSKSIPMK